MAKNITLKVVSLICLFLCFPLNCLTARADAGSNYIAQVKEIDPTNPSSNSKQLWVWDNRPEYGVDTQRQTSDFQETSGLGMRLVRNAAYWTDNYLTNSNDPNSFSFSKSYVNSDGKTIQSWDQAMAMYDTYNKAHPNTPIVPDIMAGAYLSSWKSANHYDDPDCDPLKGCTQPGYQALANLAHQAAARYPQIHYWELYNEMDYNYECDFFGGVKNGAGVCANLENEGKYYAQMLKVVYPAIKSANPDALVVLGGLATNFATDGSGNVINRAKVPNINFLKGVYENGGKEFFDIANIHTYGHPMSYLSYYLGMYYHVFMAQQGDAYKPLWNTEYGIDAGGIQRSTNLTKSTARAYYFGQLGVTDKGDKTQDNGYPHSWQVVPPQWSKYDDLGGFPLYPVADLGDSNIYPAANDYSSSGDPTATAPFECSYENAERNDDGTLKYDNEGFDNYQCQLWKAVIDTNIQLNSTILQNNSYDPSLFNNKFPYLYQKMFGFTMSTDTERTACSDYDKDISPNFCPQAILYPYFVGEKDPSGNPGGNIWDFNWSITRGNSSLLLERPVYTWLKDTQVNQAVNANPTFAADVSFDVTQYGLDTSFKPANYAYSYSGNTLTIKAVQVNSTLPVKITLSNIVNSSTNNSTTSSTVSSNNQSEQLPQSGPNRANISLILFIVGASCFMIWYRRFYEVALIVQRIKERLKN